MKMTKRIFIALLVVSVFVSLFALSAFAAEENEIDYGYLLEYYEEPVLFDYDFSAEDVSYSLFLSDDNKDRMTSTIVEDENAPGGKYLSVVTPASKGIWEDVIVKNNVYFSWNSDTPVDDFIIDMTVSGARGSGEEKQLPKIVISLSDAVCADPDAGAAFGNTVVALDFRSGCLSYLKRTVNTEGEVYGVMTNTDFALTEGAWYSVYMQYDSESSVAYLTVTDLSDNTKVYSASDVYAPYTEIKSLRVGAHSVDGATSRDNVMNFASLRAIGGKYDRDPAELQSVMEKGILDMHADFISDEVDLDTKSYLADVAVKLSSYGFVTENEEVAAAYSELLDGVVTFCNGKLLEYIAAYDTLFDYYDRRDLVDTALVYVNYVNSLDPGKIPTDIADEVALNIQAVNNLDSDLLNAELSSIALINAVGDVTSIDYDDYDLVVQYYNNLHQYGQYADPTYNGASDAYVFYSTVSEAKADIELKATRFINAANVLNSGADFNTRADAFLICKNHYYDNTTYPGVATALELYDFHYDNMNTQIEMAENFIKFVNKADYADYIPMKLENLNEAKKYINCLTADPYRGVTEAKAVYDRVKAEVEEQVTNANLYIAAVNKLDGLTGDALTAAIEEALRLQENGNVLGVDGVTDANIKLDQIISAIELAPKHRDYFIGLVNSIDSAANAEELYGILVEAKSAEAKALEAVKANPSYESSVKSASAKLAQAIEDFNAQVAVVNSTFAKANAVAANTCGIGKGTTPVADRVIALIKKFFDEE